MPQDISLSEFWKNRSIYLDEIFPETNKQDAKIEVVRS